MADVLLIRSGIRRVMFEIVIELQSNNKDGSNWKTSGSLERRNQPQELG